MSATEWAKRWSLRTPESLRARARELGAFEYRIKGMLPVRSITVVLGDSGLGKSALVYQLAICVATGVPFLGCETKQGRVVIADFENGIGDMEEFVERLSQYLGSPGLPDDLYLWSLSDCDAKYGQPGHTLLDMLRDVRPSLAIVDSLGSYAPEAEEKNSSTTKMLQEFRLLMRECGTDTLLVHHRRKQSRNGEQSAGPLESANLRQWFQDARGASTLVNGSDIRLGVNEPDISAVSKDEVALVVRGFGRVRGEIGPLFLARDADENGNACGYRHLVGPELLFDEHRQKVLAELPQQFTFKRGKTAYGRGDQATMNFLQRCIALRLVHKLSRGCYEKTPEKKGDAEDDGAHREKG
jgi:KaiC/GvpD/RAD55 family RecA-like ATPase